METAEASKIMQDIVDRAQTDALNTAGFIFSKDGESFRQGLTMGLIKAQPYIIAHIVGLITRINDTEANAANHQKNLRTLSDIIHSYSREL